MPTTPDKAAQKLAKLMRKNRTDIELAEFLEDLFTPTELEMLVERWDIVAALLKGATQREAIGQLGVSFSKITRASNVLKRGRGSFRRVWATK